MFPLVGNGDRHDERQVKMVKMVPKGDPALGYKRVMVKPGVEHQSTMIIQPISFSTVSTSQDTPFFLIFTITMLKLLPTLFALLSGAVAIALPSLRDDSSDLVRRQTNCANSATSRSCWGDYSIDTNYYDETPTTNVTREYWLSVESTSCAPDGYNRTCMTFNGTVPGPLITVSVTQSTT